MEYVKIFFSAFAVGVLAAIIAFLIIARRKEKISPEEVPLKRLGKMLIIISILFIIIATPLSTDMAGRRNPDPTAVTYKGYTAYEGFQVAIDYNCMDCHTITGNGAFYAPELARVARQAGSPEAINAMLKGIVGTPNMPFHLTDEQIDKLTAWLYYLGQLNTNDWPPVPPGSYSGNFTDQTGYSFEPSYEANSGRWYESPSAWAFYWLFTAVVTALLFYAFLYWNVRGDGS